MNIIRIGESERSLDEVNESWITHQVRERQRDVGSVCVQLVLKSDGVDMVLSTPQCGGCTGSREPNEKERRLIVHWKDRHLSEPNWSVGDLIAFLKQSKLLH